MNIKAKALGLFLMLICISASATETIQLNGRHSVRDLKPWLFFTDNHRFLRLLDVIDTIPVQHPYEFEFRVYNTSPEKAIYYLVLGGGSVFADWVSIDDVVYQFPKSYTKIEVEGNHNALVRFRLAELDRMSTDRLLPQLLTPDDLEQKERGGKRIQPFFIGVFSFMVLFNIFYFTISGWRVYLKYAVYILLSLTFFSHYFGFLQFLFPRVATISNNLVWILTSIIAPSYVYFISDFGDFKRLNLKAHRTFQFGVWFKFVQMPVEILLWFLNFDFIHTRQYLFIIMIVEVSVTLLGFYYLAVSKGALAKIILVASLILLVGSVLGQINPFQNIDRVIIIETGTLIEIMIFSMSLAFKTKEMDTKRLMATEQLLAQTQENIKIQEKISNQLEQLVHERTAKLEMRNRENETLLAEIHHRVKNNLQIISSLINLKAKQSNSQETNEVLQQLNGRIFSLGLVHEKLYQNKNIQTIRLDEYLEELCRHLLTSFEEKEHPVLLRTNCESLEMDLDKALTCGLITNELFTNSMKYAFSLDQNHREIGVTLSSNGNLITLQVFDNGKSIKPVAGDLNKSFGLRFVDQLVKSKLGGSWEATRENGSLTSIQFMYPGNGKN